MKEYEISKPLFERLERLEKQNLLLKRVGLAVLIVFSALAVVAWTAEDHYQYSGQFLVKDEYGNIRAMLGHSESLGRLHIGRLEQQSGGFKPDLRNSVSIAGGADEPFLGILGHTGRNGIVMTTKKNGEVVFGLTDATGNTRISIAIAKDGAPQIQCMDATGKVTWATP